MKSQPQGEWKIINAMLRFGVSRKQKIGGGTTRAIRLRNKPQGFPISSVCAQDSTRIMISWKCGWTVT